VSRIRSIHPGLWTDEAFVSLSPMARLFLMGLWNECDDAGSFAWSPLGLKMRILPADNVDAAELMAEMTAACIVCRYEVGGKSYGAVRNFCRFQRPKKPNSVHPQTAEIRAWVGSEARSSAERSEPVPHHSGTNGQKAPQMEDGGWRMEEEKELSSNDDSASDDEPSLRPEHVFEHYQELAQRIGRPVPRDFTPERRQLTRSRITQYSLNDFLTVFAKCRDSPFLRGDRGRTPLTFDWLMKKGNFQKALEGNYDR
jgi:hypothetical protein